MFPAILCCGDAFMYQVVKIQFEKCLDCFNRLDLANYPRLRMCANHATHSLNLFLFPVIALFRFCKITYYLVF